MVQCHYSQLKLYVPWKSNSKLNTDETISMADTEYFGETAVTGIKTDSHFWIF